MAISPRPKLRRDACIGCAAPLQTQVFDFGAMPISNSLLHAEQIGKGEMFYPMRVMACEACTLVQLAHPPPPEAHFHGDYVYFSSYSASWMQHCAAYTEAVIERFGLEPGDQVIEVASNDGYLLGYFQQRGLSVLGVEPSESVAKAAQAKGIATEVRFFGAQTARDLAERGVRPRLLVANNVFAHVPDLEDFTKGFAVLLSGNAVLSVEVHYFRDLFEKAEFDSFYHEHYSYFTIGAAERLFSRHKLRLFDVERLLTHGGSLRLFACRDDAPFALTSRLEAALREDHAFFKTAMSRLGEFQDRVIQTCDELRRFLVEARRSGKRAAGFGAPAKATTLLNFARVTPDLLPYTVDSNPQKQNRYVPGVHIPILSPDVLKAERPDYVLVLPWNLKSELADHLAALTSDGTRLVCAIPRLEFF
jgi:SAM-dependent methyltransferase